jgi:hypothetical protein
MKVWKILTDRQENGIWVSSAILYEKGPEHFYENQEATLYGDSISVAGKTSEESLAKLKRALAEKGIAE